jgi:hypothetical protein
MCYRKRTEKYGKPQVFRPGMQEALKSNYAVVATWVLGYPGAVFIFGMPRTCHMPVSRFAKIGAR